MELLNGQFRWITTPLHGAVSSGQIDMVTLLLENGADPNIALKNGMTALMFSKEERGHGHNDGVRAILNKVWIIWMEGVLTPRNKVGQLLLEAGANPEKMNNRGLTPLLLAQHLGRTDMVKMMKSHING